MKYSLVILLFLVFGCCFSQDLEESIYLATETFNKNRTTQTFSDLVKNEAEFSSKLKTKDHYFAYLFLLVNKADYLYQSNQQPKAITAYEAALDVYNTQQLNKTFVYDITEYCLKPLGILYHKIGDYTNAENTIKHYIFLAEKQKNNPHRISGAINLANLYYTLGKFNAALNIAKNGLDIKGASAIQKQALQQVINKSAIQNNSELKKNPNVLALKNKYDNDSKYHLALKNKDYKTALFYFKTKYLQINKGTLTARTVAKLNFEEAQLHYKLNDFKSTSVKLKLALQALLPNYNLQNLPKKETLYPENTFIDIFDLLALLQSNLDNTLACYDLSFYVSTLLTNNLTSQESKLIHLHANRKRSESIISALYKAYQNTKDTTLIKQAFAYAEKNKASILKEIIGKKTLLERHPTDTLLIKELTLLQQQELLTNTLIKVQYQQDVKQINKLSQELTSVSIALKKLKVKIKAKYPEPNDVDISISKLQHKLKTDHAVLVEYFYGENHIFQFIISATAISLNNITRDAVFNTAISDYIHYFDNSSVINNNIPQFSNAAFKLYKALHFDKTLAFKNVVIITDGFLNFIPFESLLTQSTDSKNYSKMPFVVNNQVLAYNTSALFYLNASDFKYEDKVLGVFPVFDNSDAKLTYSLDEAKSIDKQTNAKFLMYHDATKSNAMQQAKNYGVLHLSTHASSGTFTIPANIDFIDQKLFLNDLYSLNLKNQLVVLSACETGIGKLQKGEGSMNLARGFQYAGVENLLFSLWKINDLSTSQLMASFYKNYSQSHSPFIANRLAKLDYLKDQSISNIKKSPYYWSTFIYYGHLTPEKPTVNSKYIIFTFIGLGIALLLWIIIRKRKNGPNA
ncbi:CHAT domain-containing protein [Olleya sp. UBA1516]|uniref:CHAT domain-containing protein n=1 Tax=Olleya sp. UBA1516 TaxID=1947013 RepID=UPI0025E9FA69|nr:CHAT domain-containing protein [Olleya sp. UBA1516]|tara:strand:- start:250301 stop:252874 length:2574 start_codon:yes stop_codon:yes gene_type:complete